MEFIWKLCLTITLKSIILNIVRYFYSIIYFLFLNLLLREPTKLKLTKNAVNIVNSESNLLNYFNDLKMIIESSNQMDVMKPLNTFLQNE